MRFRGAHIYSTTRVSHPSSPYTGHGETGCPTRKICRPPGAATRARRFAVAASKGRGDGRRRNGRAETGEVGRVEIYDEEWRGTHVMGVWMNFELCHVFKRRVRWIPTVLYNDRRMVCAVSDDS